MKKWISILILSVSASQAAFAAKLECVLHDFKNTENAELTFTVEGSDNPHGEMVYLQSKLFPEVKGFVALFQNDGKMFAVMQLRSETLGVGSSSQYELVADRQYIQHQLLLPFSDSTGIDGLEVSCLYLK